MALAPDPAARVAAAIYLAASLLLFGTSAIYHRFYWGPRGDAILRRMDHANIYIFIAGTYTPLAVLLLPPRAATTLLTLVWTSALAGLLFRLFWLSAPRWLYTALYIAMGWGALFWLPQFLTNGGAAVFTLILAGAALHGRRGGLRPQAPRPLPDLVRLPRDLPRLHDPGLRLPLRGDLLAMFT